MKRLLIWFIKLILPKRCPDLEHRFEFWKWDISTFDWIYCGVFTFHTAIWRCVKCKQKVEGGTIYEGDLHSHQEEEFLKLGEIPLAEVEAINKFWDKQYAHDESNKTLWRKE